MSLCLMLYTYVIVSDEFELRFPELSRTKLKSCPVEHKTLLILWFYEFLDQKNQLV